MTRALVAVSDPTYGGVYYSSNIDFTSLTTQPTWTKLPTTGLANTLVKVMRCDPVNPYDNIYLQLDNDNIYRWNGVSWTLVMDLATAQSFLGGCIVGYIATNQITAGKVYIAAQTVARVTLLYSVDYGATWNAEIVDTDLMTGNPYVAAHEDSIVVCTGEIYRMAYTGSIGGGWTPIYLWNNSGGGATIRIDPANPAYFYYRKDSSDADLIRAGGGVITEIQNGNSLASNLDWHEHMHWIDPTATAHHRILRSLSNNVSVYSTVDSWTNFVNATPTVLKAGFLKAVGAHRAARENPTYAMFGVTEELGGQGLVEAFVGDNPAASYIIAGTNWNTPPYTNAIPYTANAHVAFDGIWVGEGINSAQKGIYIYSVETDTYDYDHHPMIGDRSAHHTLSYPDEHAEDVQKDTPTIHTPFPGPVGSGIVSDGTKWIVSSSAAGGPTYFDVISSKLITAATTEWYGRATVENVSGVIVMVYKDASGHADNDGHLHIRFSNDYGVTWTAQDTKIGGGAVTGFPMNPTGAGAGEDAGEPWLIIAPNGDLLLHMWRVDYGVTANGTYQSRSTDGGLTWSASAQINFTGIADDTKVFSTDDHFVYGTTIYIGARQYDDAVPTNSKSIFLKSTDNGTTWEYISDVSSFTTDTTEYGFEYIGNSTIVAILRSLDDKKCYSTYSTDMGATWAALTDITATIGVAARCRIQTRSHLKGYDDWWLDPVLIMNGFTQPTDGSSYPRVNCIWVSMDRGTSWIGPLNVDASTDDAGYGDMFWNPTADQYVYMSYYGTNAVADIKQYNIDLPGIEGPGYNYNDLTDIPATFTPAAHTLDSHSDVDTTGVGTGDILYKSAGDWVDYPLGIGSKISVTSNKLRIGNSSGGNYLEIDLSTGNLRLAGSATAWDDLLFAASVVKPGATAPSYKAFGPSGSLQALMFEASHHDEVHFEVQLPHRWKEGSKIYPHVHWCPTTADAGNVVWELEYAWTNINGTFGAPSNMASDATAAGGTAWVHKLTKIKSGGNDYIDGTGKTMSSMLVCRLHRNSNAGSDTLNKDVALLDIDFHVEIDSFGSDEELVKDATSALLLETGDYLLLENGDNILME